MLENCPVLPIGIIVLALHGTTGGEVFLQTAQFKPVIRLSRLRNFMTERSFSVKKIILIQNEGKSPADILYFQR